MGDREDLDELRRLDELEARATPVPSMGQVAMNAVPKGVANFVNTPVALYNLGKAGLSKLGVDVSEPTPNYPMQAMQSAGLVNPAYDPQTPEQRIVDTAIQTGVGMLAMPAKGLAEAAKNAGLGLLGGTSGQVTKEATGSDALAFAVGAATPLVASRAWAPATTSIQTPVGQQTLKEAIAAGYVVPPSMTKPSFVGNKLESIAGKAAVAQDAALRNQQVTNVLAARALGIPEGTPLSMGAIEEVRKNAAKPYEEIAKLIPGGELQGLKVTTVRNREMVQGPVTGMQVSTSAQRSMLPGPATGLKVTRKEGPPPTTGVSVQEVRDDAGNLIGLRTVKQSEGTAGALEGLKANVTSRGPDVPGPLEGYQVNVDKRYAPDVPGPLQGMRVNVEATRGGIPLEELKQARSDATAFYRHYDRSADPASLKAAKAASARAYELEAEIEATVKRLGRPDLVEQLRAARQKIAQTYDVERALNLGDGNISAQVIGRLLDQGRPLSGELALIGRFAQAFPRVSREGAMVPAAGVSGTDAFSSAILGGMGYGAGGATGAAIGAGLPLLRAPARNMSLSDMMQKRLLRDPSPLSQLGLKGAMIGKSLLDYHDVIERD